MSTADQHDDEHEALVEFREHYRVPPTVLSSEIERAVLGSDWGANGYTTRRQADRLGAWLGLGPETRLLDVGSGRGWPGMYLAASTGCEVVVSDMPVEGLRLARQRARREGLEAAVSAVAASAGAMPFRPGSFDAVVHTDVL